jgi:hypothetical protein
MSKKAYLFVTGSALLSLVGVSLAEAPSFLLEAAEQASYTKSVTLTGAMLQTNRSHTEYTIEVGGLTLTIGNYVYRDSSTGRIYIDGTKANGATIVFPSVQAVSGAHGTGYASVDWKVPSLSGNYCYNVGVQASSPSNTTSALTTTLTNNATTNTAIPSDYSSSIKLYSVHSSGYATVLTAITITYNCSAS